MLKLKHSLEQQKKENEEKAARAAKLKEKRTKHVALRDQISKFNTLDTGERKALINSLKNMSSADLTDPEVDSYNKSLLSYLLEHKSFNALDEVLVEKPDLAKRMLDEKAKLNPRFFKTIGYTIGQDPERDEYLRNNIATPERLQLQETWIASSKRSLEALEAKMEQSPAYTNMDKPYKRRAISGFSQNDAPTNDSLDLFGQFFDASQIEPATPKATIFKKAPTPEPDNNLTTSNEKRQEKITQLNKCIDKHGIDPAKKLEENASFEEIENLIFELAAELEIDLAEDSSNLYQKIMQKTTDKAAKPDGPPQKIPS
jgi:hypothetical protein